MYPTALRGHTRLDGLDCGGQSGATVCDDQQQPAAVKAAPVRVLKQCLPVSLPIESILSP